MLVFLLGAKSQALQRNQSTSVNPDWPRSPIQSKRCHASIRNAVARCPCRAKRRIKSQLVELVAEISMEGSSQRAMQTSAEKAVTIAGRIVGGTSGLRRAIALVQL